MQGKVRPVGSRVYPPKPDAEFQPLPWQDLYRTYFVNSGTAALSLALAVAKERKPVACPEVLIPAYGCPDLVAAVIAQGARPVPVDLAPDRPWLDLDLLASKETPDAVAVVAVDFLGIPERLEPLRAWADARGLMLIEDAAQAFPPASSESGLADFCVLSFGRGKPLNLMGGGALLVREDWAEWAEATLAAFPSSAWPRGTKQLLRRLLFNLAIGRVAYAWLERLPFLRLGATFYRPLERIQTFDAPWDWLQTAMDHKARSAKWYRLYDSLLNPLTSRGWLLLPSLCFESPPGEGGPDRQRYPLLRYPLLAPDRARRDEAVVALNAAGIGSNAFYGKPLKDVTGVQNLLESEPEAFPNAEDWSARLLTLPCHEDVRETDVEKSARILLGLSDISAQSSQARA